MTARKNLVRVRVCPDENQRWRNAAASHGLPVSTWIRAIADDAAATGKSGSETAIELVRLRQELARGVGNNLNQMTRMLHHLRHVDIAAVEEAVRDVREMQREIERALRAIKPPRARG